jgi:hypothetical protein
MPSPPFFNSSYPILLPIKHFPTDLKLHFVMLKNQIIGIGLFLDASLHGAPVPIDTIRSRFIRTQPLAKQFEIV